MSLINGIVPRQNFEIVRDQICQILVEEIEHQFILSEDQDLSNVKVFVERTSPFDHTELPALNVGVERGDYSNQHQGHADGTYRYFIECNTKAETTEDDRGDSISKMRVQRLIGLSRAILENPVYKTLGFPTGSGAIIMHRHIESFVFAENTRHDSENVNMCRMMLVVRMVETTELIEADVVAAGNDTTIKLSETEKGFYWSI